MAHVSVARFAAGPDGWRFDERVAMRLLIVEGSSRSLRDEGDAGPPWVRLTRRDHWIRLPLHELVGVVEGRGVRVSAGTYRFSWRGRVLRQRRGAAARVVRESVPVELLVPLDRDSGRIERKVLWIVLLGERLEIELVALRGALPAGFASATRSSGPRSEQVQRLLLGSGGSRTGMTLGGVSRYPCRGPQAA